MCDGDRKQTVSTKERNRKVIKKLLKTLYFDTSLWKKTYALLENLTDTVDFFKDLGDEYIVKHLKDSSCRATYTLPPKHQQKSLCSALSTI